MTVSIWILLLCLSLPITSIGGATTSKQVYYVTPTSPAGTHCPGQPCLTLDQYIASSSTYITSNTVFKLLPGRRDITRSFVARNIESITIEGDVDGESNPQVQIGGVSSHYLLQFLKAVDVYITGIELDDVGIFLKDATNVTLHQLVVDGPKTAISLIRTTDTNIFHCSFRNTAETALVMWSTLGTTISNTFVTNTGQNGFFFSSITNTKILYSVINNAKWHGIKMEQANSTMISSCDVYSTGWSGITVHDASQTEVIDTIVNQTSFSRIEIKRGNSTVISNCALSSTKWYGIKIHNSSQTEIINTFMKEIHWSGIKIDQTSSTVIYNCTIKGTIYHGIWISNSFQTGVIDTFVNDTNWHGIKIIQTNSTVVSNCVLSNTGRSGIRVFNSSQTKVINTYMKKTNWSGFDIQQTSSTVISNCTMKRTGCRPGIRIWSSFQTKVINTIVNETDWGGIQIGQANFTIISTCVVRNTSMNGIQILNSFQTVVIHTLVMRTGWNAIEMHSATQAWVIDSILNRAGWNGIDIQEKSSHVVISYTIVNSSGYNGIRVHDSSQTTVICTCVNKTGWDGIKISHATESRVIATNITNAEWKTLDCKDTEEPCTVEIPPSFNCSCCEQNQCDLIPLNYSIPQIPPSFGTNITNAELKTLDCRDIEEPCAVETPPNQNCEQDNDSMPLNHSIPQVPPNVNESVIGTNITNTELTTLDCRDTEEPCTIEIQPPNQNFSCYEQDMCDSMPQVPPSIDKPKGGYFYVIPTSLAGTPCPGQPCLTLDQYIASPRTYITSNTVFKLLPGRHDITRSFVAENIESITIEGDVDGESNPQVQIGGVSSHYRLQFINAVDVNIAGIELDNLRISLEYAKNVTLHRVVVGGLRAAIILKNTIDTSLSFCNVKNNNITGVNLQNSYNTSITNTFLDNIGGNGFDLLNTTNTEIQNTSINSAKGAGIKVKLANHTVIVETSINNVAGDGIEVRNSNDTLIENADIDNTGWDGIEVVAATDTKLMNVYVNNTVRDGMEFNNTDQTVVVQSTVENAEWNGIEFDNTSNTCVQNTRVINAGWDGIDTCNMRSTNICFGVRVEEAARNCLWQCTPNEPAIPMGSTGTNGIRVRDSSQITVICTLVNKTDRDGIEIHCATETGVIGTNITNAELKTLEEACTVETQPSFNCSCCEQNLCDLTLLNYSIPQVPCSIDEPKGGYFYVTPTLPTGTPCPGQPCLTLDQYIANSSTYITSNTVFKLLPGRHDITRSFVAQNIESITIESDVDGESNPQVQIGGVSSHYRLQFINAVDVNIAGIELDNLRLSLEYAKNVTLHRVVVGGLRAAIIMNNTIDTSLSFCNVKNNNITGVNLQNSYNTNISNTFLDNIGGNGFDLLNTTNTEIHNTSVNSAKGTGIKLRLANRTVIVGTSINNVAGDGIEVRLSNDTLIKNADIDNTGWDGIEVVAATDTKLTNVYVNNTVRDGMEFNNTDQTAVFQCTIENAQMNGIEFDNASNTSVHNTTVINVGWDGIDICNMRSTNMWFGVTVEGAASKCLRQCTPNESAIPVECLT